MAIQFSLSTAPPQRWVLEKPKKEVLRTDTCHGHRPNEASLPPTILVSGRGNSGGTPHCIFLLSSAAATVITEPVAFSLAATSVVDDPCVVATLVALVPLALVMLLVLVVVIVAVAVVGLVVSLAEDINVDDVVLCVVVFFVGRGLVEVSKWDVVM